MKWNSFPSHHILNNPKYHPISFHFIYFNSFFFQPKYCLRDGMEWNDASISSNTFFFTSNLKGMYGAIYSIIKYLNLDNEMGAIPLLFLPSHPIPIYSIEYLKRMQVYIDKILLMSNGASYGSVVS